MKLAVSGGRSYRLTEEDIEVLDDLHEARGITLLLHGGCRGADRGALEWARTRGIETRAFPADWALQGKAAGPIRNRKMVDQADMLAAFPGGAGTRDAVNYAFRTLKPILNLGDWKAPK